MTPTPQQSAIIDDRGHHLIVAAAAGSGKTEVLTRRVVGLLADPAAPARLERMLIVTFTRAAASELRVRIGRVLRENICGPISSAMRAHLREQERRLDDAEIGTIDAWCGRVLREHFAEAGVDPGFSTLDPLGARRLRERVRDELFEWVYSADDLRARRVRHWIRHLPEPHSRLIESMLAQLHEFRGVFCDPAPWLGRLRERTKDPASAAAEAERTFASLLREELRSVADCLQTRVSSAARAVRHLSDLIDRIAGWVAALDRPGSLTGVLAEVTDVAVPRKSQKWTEAETGAAAAVRTYFCETVKKSWDAAELGNALASTPVACQRLATLLDLEQCYADRLSETKDRLRAYEFGDILQKAWRLLQPGCAAGRERAIAEKLQDRYDHVFVDEFQDTSRLQADLISTLQRTGDGNLCLVGDLKQSIYGFRRAEPAIFRAAQRRFDAEPAKSRVLPLTESFRSHARLVQGLNALFEPLFDEDFGGAVFDESARLRAGRSDLPNATLDVEPRISVRLLHTPPAAASAQPPASGNQDPPDDAAWERVELEAAIAADEIRRLVEAGTRIQARGPAGTDELRPARYSDFAILLRSARVKAAQVASVLRRRRVPASTDGREDLFAAIEVSDVCGILRLIVNERLDVPMAAYLRGPSVALSAAELLAIRRKWPTDLYSEAAFEAADRLEDAALRKKIRDALNRLSGWRARARILSPAALVDEIIRDTNAECVAASQPGGEFRVAQLEAFREFARRYGGVGLPRMISEIDSAANSDEPLATAGASHDEAVSVLTIHASKGLEFGFVYLLNAGAQFNEASARTPLQLHEKLGAAVRYFDRRRKGRVEDPQHRLIAQATLDREKQEELRLLYVAATRARERLVFIGHSKATPDSFRAEIGGSGRVPPAARREARSALDWVLLSIAASSAADSGQPELFEVESIPTDQIAPASGEEEPDNALPADPRLDAMFDDRWIDEAIAATSLGPAPPVQRPAVLSVSMLKQRVGADATPSGPRARGPAWGELVDPQFLHRGEATPTAIGNAVHRFMRHADMSRFQSGEQVRAQAAELVQRGRFEQDELELLPWDDLAWFGTSDLCATMARAQQLVRESAFVRGVGFDQDLPTLVRGVIDALVFDGNDLLIVDYKTDRIADEVALRERSAHYSVQIALYVDAARRILRRPITRAALIFLTARRIEWVDPAAPEFAAATEHFRSEVDG